MKMKMSKCTINILVAIAVLGGIFALTRPKTSQYSCNSCKKR